MSTFIYLIDPITLKTFHMTALQYFQFEKEIITISLKNNSTEFMVLNVNDESNKKNKKNSIDSSLISPKIYEIEVARVKDWETYTVKSHLGNILKENNMVLGND